MERNYITEQCCSVDDLRSHLRCWNPKDKATLNEGITNLQTSIDYEIKHQKRVTIVKMLISKRNALKKKL